MLAKLKHCSCFPSSPDRGEQQPLINPSDISNKGTIQEAIQTIATSTILTQRDDLLTPRNHAPDPQFSDENNPPTKTPKAIGTSPTPKMLTPNKQTPDDPLYALIYQCLNCDRDFLNYSNATRHFCWLPSHANTRTNPSVIITSNTQNRRPSNDNTRIRNSI